MISLFHVILSNDGFVAFHYKSCGTFFLHSKSPVTSMVVLPTTEIIEPKFTEKRITELQKAQKEKRDAPYHRRVQALIHRSEGHSYCEIGWLVGYLHVTIIKHVAKYFNLGLAAIICETRGGANRCYLSEEEEKAFFNEEYGKAAQGEYTTILKLYEAYQKKVGHKTTREGFYALLKRHGWRKVSYVSR